jgi:hypothetical protein
MNDPLDDPRAIGAGMTADLRPPASKRARLRGRSADANRPNRSPPQPGLPEGFAGHLHGCDAKQNHASKPQRNAFRVQMNDEKKQIWLQYNCRPDSKNPVNKKLLFAQLDHTLSTELCTAIGISDACPRIYAHRQARRDRLNSVPNGRHRSQIF